MKQHHRFLTSGFEEYWRLGVLLTLCVLLMLMQLNTLQQSQTAAQFIMQSMYCVLFGFISAACLYFYRRTPRKVFRQAVMPKDEASWPDVAVLIPSDGAPQNQLEVCLIAASQLDYPKRKLTIYLKDNAVSVAQRYQGDSAACVDANYRFKSLQYLCQRLGIELLDCPQPQDTRTTVVEALKGCDQPYVLVLEPSQIVGQKAIQSLLPHLLEDSSLAVVQSTNEQAFQDAVSAKLQRLSTNVDGVIKRSAGSREIEGSTAMIRRAALAANPHNKFDIAKHCLDVVEPVAIKTVQSHGKTQPLVNAQSDVFAGLFRARKPQIERPNIVNIRWQAFLQAAPSYIWLALGLPSLILLTGIVPLAGVQNGVVGLALLAALGASIVYRFRHVTLTELLNHLVNSLTILMSGTNRLVSLGRRGVSKSHALHQRLSQSLSVAMIVSLAGLAVGLIRLAYCTQPLMLSAVLLVQLGVIALLFAAIATVQPASQRRLWPRHSMNLKARCEVAGRRYFCEVVNMSVGGMAIELDAVAARYAKKGASIRVYGFSEQALRKYSFQCNVASQRVNHIMSLGLIVMCGTDVEYANMVKFIYGDTSRWKTSEKASSLTSELKAMALLMKHGVRFCLLHLITVGSLLPAMRSAKPEKTAS